MAPMLYSLYGDDSNEPYTSDDCDGHSDQETSSIGGDSWISKDYWIGKMYLRFILGLQMTLNSHPEEDWAEIDVIRNITDTSKMY